MIFASFPKFVKRKKNKDFQNSKYITVLEMSCRQFYLKCRNVFETQLNIDDGIFYEKMVNG